MEKNYDVVIIGAGPGGYETALKAAKVGLKTAIIEKGEVGGTCLNRGCIPTKTILHSAETYAEILQAAEVGVNVSKPEIDMQVVQNHKEEVIGTLQKGIMMLMKSAKVDYYQGLGKLIASKEVEISMEDGTKEVLTAQNVILATGSKPATPPIPGADSKLVFTSDELLNYSGKPFESMLIIGGGVIGIEFASIYSALGTKVTIVEALPGLLANMDKEFGQSIKMSLKKKGADIHTNAKVLELEETDGKVRCTFEEKEVKEQCEADVVLMAVGRRPYTEGLLSEDVTLQLERGFVVVDENYESTIPGVYAIGDVNGKLQLAHAATAMGIHVIEKIARERNLIETDSKGTMLIPACVYTNPEIASVGLTVDEAKERGIMAKSHKIVSSANGKSVLTNQERGFVKVVYDEESKQILGAQMMCARATDMISEFAVAIEQKMTMEEMEQITRPHPSFSEMITQAVTL